MPATSAYLSHRTLFISDLHLGSRFSDVESISDFLQSNDAETIFLVGDIFDLWSLGRRVRWSEGHSHILKLLLAKVQAGTRVVLLPGNHDDNLRAYLGLGLGNIEVRHDFIYRTLDGKQYLVVHGDEHDLLVCRLARLSRLACRLKERFIPLTRRPQHASAPAASDRSYLERFTGNCGQIELGLVKEAARLGVDGVISGHTHQPADRMLEGVHYLNCGDWLGSSTAVSECWSGRLSLLHWHSAPQSRMRRAELPSAARPMAQMAEIAT